MVFEFEHEIYGTTTSHRGYNCGSDIGDIWLQKFHQILQHLQLGGYLYKIRTQ